MRRKDTNTSMDPNTIVIIHVLECNNSLWERTGVCEMTVKRTRLCYWIARPTKPKVQSSYTRRVRFTVISYTPVRSRFYHIHILYKRNRDGFWLMNSTQKVTPSYIFFKFAICFIALLSLGETCNLKGRGMVTVWRTLLLLSCHAV